jgi:hypothetical protein
VHDGSMDGETNLASEVGAHVGGCLVVDCRWVVKVVDVTLSLNGLSV